MLFELDLDSLNPYLSRSNAFAHLPEYPITDYDVSMLFDLSVKWEEILDVILAKRGENELVQKAFFVDEYKGKQVPQGKKSVTIRLVIGSPYKTLTSNEIDSNANATINRLIKHLGAELRN
ncbi:MAG: phenylalanine--tRNA ligase subunit beta-related protein [Saccharofermentanales bacterium]